ncbi:MAG TPA: histidine ammonia-lyase [Calditrichaeota bacterium]|nr:histidine ammonia-lyase [Calditrichota bacterium]
MNNRYMEIGQADLSLSDIRFFIEEKPSLRLSRAVIDQINASRRIVEDILQSGRVVYGVNTGFGKFADVRIERGATAELQRRLVLSHAAGVGNPMPEDVVRLMMLLKIKNLSLGHSGARLEVVERLVEMLNNGVAPVVPEKGSVGASGDLAPLAHMAAVMIGEGEAFYQGERLPGAQALQKVALKPLVLQAKEGLAVLNGTQAIQAYGLHALLQAENLLKTADIIGAITLEALLGTLTAFDPRIQEIRRHPGQQVVAENVRRLLAESPIVESHRESDHRVQDAYSLRCIPQVHGAVRDGVAYVRSVFEREMNGVTDNPLVFPENGDVLSGGNFHGEPVALAADYLGILLAELANISERRIEHMLDPAVSEMAGFLTKEGGLNSGFMMAHVTAAALVSENKVLAHPSSVDSIPTSANKEDHVSMGTYAARKALQIVDNVENVLAVELICACQALDLRAPLEPARSTARVLNKVRETIAHWAKDRFMHTDLLKAKELIRNGQIIKTAEAECGKLK